MPNADDTPRPGTGEAPAAPAPASPGLPPAQRALALAVHEVETHASAAGWDAPPRLFALVSTARALAEDPSLAHRLPPDALAAAAADPHHVLSVEQEGFDVGADLEDALARVAWPSTVDGTALVVERIVLPPSAEEGVPEDPAAALDHLANHPDRQDVRVAVGVLRGGPAWCAVRSRAHDAAADVASGPDLVPGLVTALRATLED
ncbi:PPA1309 family protein [Cellulosimicrobium sp. NPDC057127]|uniref:PPA1309 family protein n=1 Tax=Cellulosimicrobium sp. NPDC057127 TaxID=3346026 RepID=UPI003633370E